MISNLNGSGLVRIHRKKAAFTGSGSGSVRLSEKNKTKAIKKKKGTKDNMIIR